jgi:phospholipase/lecithinase/hemolysin
MVVIGKRLAAAVVAITLTLAGCGGGDPKERYVPTRIIVFGDELSLIEAGGGKYTINALNATTSAIDCVGHPMWVQAVAGSFGMTFPECPNGTLLPNAEMRAAVGETVATMTTKINTYDLTGAPNAPKRQDLVLMLVGMHDVLDLYNESPRRSEAAMTTELEARGLLLAQQVNRLAMRPGGNPVVIVSTIPDLGHTPLARTAGDGALLSRLSTAFNSALRVNMVQDGRLVGIVFADAEIQGSVGSPATRGYIDVTTPACTVALPGCTTATLVAGATGISHLWADTLRPGPRFQESMGAQAVSRALNNPF